MWISSAITTTLRDSDISNGMGWDNTSGPKSLFAREQDPSNGVGFWFAKISSLVRPGGQPNATKKLQFSLHEYNDTGHS